MELSNFTLIILIIVLLIEVVAFYYALKNNKLRKLVAATQTSVISDIGDGFHEIKGQLIKIGEPLISPYSEKPCLYYNFLVEEKRSNGKTESWVELIKDEKMSRFGVHDGSGIAIVDPENARIDLKSENEFKPADSVNMSYAIRERILKAYGVKSINGTYERTVRFHEHILEEGLQVYVMGQVQGKDNGYPLFKVQGKPLWISDQSEAELIELYTNRMIYSIVVMISVPLGLLLFWLMEWF